MTSQARPQAAAAERLAAPIAIDLADLGRHVGQQLGYSRWHEITQEDVSRFADLTNDGQWIHVDTERAASGPYGATVAHGFYTLSRFTSLLGELLAVGGVQTVLNLGVNRVRFPGPARVGARIRLGLAINGVEPVGDGGVQVLYGATFEVEGQDRPACVAEVVFRYYPGESEAQAAGG
jgi:acyl dehydratase